MWKVWINLNLFKKELNWPGLNRLVNSSLSPASQISKKRKRDGANIYEMSFVILKLFCNYLMPEVTDNMILWFVRLLVSLISCVNVVDNIESGSIPRRLGQVKLGQSDELICHNVPDDWARPPRRLGNCPPGPPSRATTGVWWKVVVPRMHSTSILNNYITKQFNYL